MLSGKGGGLAALVGAVALLVGLHGPALAVEVGPTTTAPGSTAPSATGALGLGDGRTFTLDEVDLSQFSEVFWGPSGPNAVQIAMDGAVDEPGETLTFAGGARIHGMDGKLGFARFTGATEMQWCYSWNCTEYTTSPVETQVTLVAETPEGDPRPFFASWFAEVDNGSVVTDVPNADGYKVNVLYEARFPEGHPEAQWWQPAAKFFHDYGHPEMPADPLKISFDAGYFWTPEADIAVSVQNVPQEAVVYDEIVTKTVLTKIGGYDDGMDAVGSELPGVVPGLSGFELNLPDGVERRSMWGESTSWSPTEVCYDERFGGLSLYCKTLQPGDTMTWFHKLELRQAGTHTIKIQSGTFLGPNGTRVHDPNASNEVGSFTIEVAKLPTTAKLSVTKPTDSKVKGAGEVSPTLNYGVVDVKLFHKKGGRFVVVDSETTFLSKNAFSSVFPRVDGARCKMTARLRGMPNSRASAASKIFNC